MTTSPDPRSYPATPLVGVSAAVFRDGRVLIARRASSPMAGVWSLPGGLVETGEPLRTAAAREIMEETGVVADIVSPADVVEVIRRDGEGRVERHYVIVSFAARWSGGEAEPGDGTDAVEWVETAALEGFELTGGTAAVIAKAAAILKED